MKLHEFFKGMIIFKMQFFTENEAQKLETVQPGSEGVIYNLEQIINEAKKIAQQKMKQPNTEEENKRASF